jgi:serine/threonine protein kinase
MGQSQIEGSLKSEIAIMRSLDHPNIVKLYEALEDEVSQKIYLVMEYCPRGALLSNDFWKSQVNNKSPIFGVESPTASSVAQRTLSFFDAMVYFIQIAEGLDYCIFY